METSRTSTTVRKTFSDMKDLPMDMIKGILWAEATWKILHDGLNKTFLNWCDIVLKMCDEEENKQEWAKIFIDQYEDTCCDLVYDMEFLHGNVVRKIEGSLQKIQELCKVLQIEMPAFEDETMSLFQQQQQLKKRIEEYEQAVEARRKELDQLREKQLELCQVLGKEPKLIKDNPLPSSDEIADFQNEIDKLEEEKFRRLEKFYSVKEECIRIALELKLNPLTEFEKHILSEDDPNFFIKNDNMKQMDRFLQSLISQRVNVVEEINQLWNSINQLWNLLDIGMLERERFRQKYETRSLAVLEALRLEKKRCEDLKKENIKVFVDKMRNELEQIWKQCHCTDEVKTEFKFFYSDCYTEDLLELYEVQLKKWKTYFGENKELLLVLEKHNKLWFKMIELEMNATGAGRYNNRGGQLLKEEKERNKLSKQIPKIEDTLQELSDMFEARHGIPFTTYGQTIVDYISNLHADRENARKQKLSARKLQRENTMLSTPGTKSMALFPTTSTQNIPSTSKRKLLGTPTPNTNKKLKPTTGHETAKRNRQPIPKITITTANRSKRISIERQKRINKIRRISASKLRKANILNDTSRYGEFEVELSSKTLDCRSTLLQPQYIPLPETPKAQTKTPTKLKTPTFTSPRTPNNNNTKFTAVRNNLKLIF